MTDRQRSPGSLALACIATAFAVVASLAQADDTPHVSVERLGEGFVLVRNGTPMKIKGVGGAHSLEDLAAIGGNAIRTWSAADLDRERRGSDGKFRRFLDDAHRLGVGVCAGFWMEHPRHHNFDYSDPAAVEKQLEHLREFVTKHKDHPAILMWGIGNEVELFADESEIFRHLDRAAKMVKQIDPNHPTMVVVAEIGDNKAVNFRKHCPNVDILGINSYAGMGSLAERLAKQGYDAPFIVTEFGPAGHWETGATPWGAPYEQTSTEKATTLAANYRSTIEGANNCLGGFAFLWSWKQERTSTWYGMWLETGESLGAVDALARLWTGSHRANSAPITSPIDAQADIHNLSPGQRVPVRVDVQDPDGDDLHLIWLVRHESTDRKAGGDDEARPKELRELTIAGPESAVIVRAPADPGNYRLFMFARDNQGNAATANVPIRVVK